MFTRKSFRLISVIQALFIIATLILFYNISTIKFLNSSDNSFIFNLDQKDVKLIDYIKSHHLTRPANSNQTYNFDIKVGKHLNGYSSIVAKLFNGKTEGTFIEAGAYDGEAASNSLYLEEIGWKGILVECNPLILPKLRGRNRKAWIAEVCLSPSPGVLNFTTPIEWPASAKLGKALDEKEMKEVGIDWMKNKTWLHYELFSFPLYSIIKAVEEFKVIDFLSLDVEGVEISILKNFPFEEFPIKVIIVEIHTYTNTEKLELEKFMVSKGYELYLKAEIDYVFTLKNFKNL